MSDHSRLGSNRPLALHAAAAVVLAALAAGCGGGGPDSPSSTGGSHPLVYGSTDVPLTIPDSGGEATSYLTVTGAPTSITKVTVKLSIWHPRDDDLWISLFAPSGAQVALSNNNGGSGAGYTNTVFDDSASIFISDAGAPFTGTYRPQWPLSIFEGENANGTWRLKVIDMFPGYVGTIDSWSIQIW